MHTDGRPPKPMHCDIMHNGFERLYYIMKNISIYGCLVTSGRVTLLRFKAVGVGVSSRFNQYLTASWIFNVELHEYRWGLEAGDGTNYNFTLWMDVYKNVEPISSLKREVFSLCLFWSPLRELFGVFDRSPGRRSRTIRFLSSRQKSEDSKNKQRVSSECPQCIPIFILSNFLSFSKLLLYSMMFAMQFCERSIVPPLAAGMHIPMTTSCNMHYA